MTGIKYASGEFQIGRCDRCARERPLIQFVNDLNSPGLRVCPPWLNQGCQDQKDPWRLPPRQSDPIVSRYPRPDVTLTDPLAGVEWDSVNYWDEEENWDQQSITQQQNQLSG